MSRFRKQSPNNSSLMPYRKWLAAALIVILNNMKNRLLAKPVHAIYHPKTTCRSFRMVKLFRLIVALLAVLNVANASRAVQIDPGFVGSITVLQIDNGIFGTGSSSSTQLAFGPGPDANRLYLYLSSPTHGVRRAVYDPAAGLTGLTTILPNIRGNGLAFRTNANGQNEIYLSEPYTANNLGFSRLWKVVDSDGDGDFTDAGTQSAAIVRGIPRNDHGLNHVQIIGDSLYVGNGVRTRNGDFQTFPPEDAFGESAYGGTILKIANLNNVETVNDSAGFFPATPTSTEYRNLINGTNPVGSSPFISVADDKLRVMAAGTRNPFGLAVDKNGELFFTNNFQRAENHVFDRNDSGAAADLDAFGGDGFSDDIHDQMHKVVEFADYGYRNTNWQNNSQATGAGFFAAAGAKASLTFDNWSTPNAVDADIERPSSDPPHNPANPDGLGPHSSSNGLDFFYDVGGSSAFNGLAFVARWNSTVNDGGQSLTYRDVVSVDVTTGDVSRVLFDVRQPLDILADGLGNLLILEWNGGILLATPSVLEGDYNRDGAVNAADYIVWRSQLGTEGANLIADGNRNGTIEQGDYDVWRSQFGETRDSGAIGALTTSSVPEPVSWVMLLTGVLVMCNSTTFRLPTSTFSKRCRIRCSRHTHQAAQSPMEIQKHREMNTLQRFKWAMQDGNIPQNQRKNR